MTAVRPEFRLCRAHRHAMDEYTPLRGEYDGPDWGRTYAFRCIRCGTKRFITLDMTGQISTSRYIRPDGYSLTRDEVPTADELRLEILKDVRRARRSNVTPIRKRRSA